MFLLDTNVLSETRRVRPHGAVIQWLAGLREGDVHVSAVSLGELQRGVEITRPRDLAKALEIERWIDEIADAYNVLSVDGRAFRLWARLMRNKSEDLSEDAMIAATALVRGLTVATRNVRDFEWFAVPTLNPFETTG